ncbi:Hsp20 family protein, partial [bacterium]|nr:Hsp20 family protein [bacterium]
NRRFRLDNAIDAEKIGAGFESGVLTIHLPKVEIAKPRRIEISGN